MKTGVLKTLERKQEVAAAVRVSVNQRSVSAASLRPNSLLFTSFISQKAERQAGGLTPGSRTRGRS